MIPQRMIPTIFSTLLAVHLIVAISVNPQQDIITIPLTRVNPSLTTRDLSALNFYPRGINRFDSQQVLSTTKRSTSYHVPYPHRRPYSAQMQVGTQTLDISLDTGTTEMFVLGPQCEAFRTKIDSFYDPTLNRRSVKTENSVTLPDGSRVTGAYSTATVTMGKRGTLPAAKFLEASRLDGPVSLDINNPTVGNMGLGYSKKDSPEPTVFSSLLNEAPTRKFAFRLDQDGGELYLGGIKFRSTQLLGTLSFAQPQSLRPEDQGKWLVNVQSIAIGGIAGETRSFVANVDTGSPFVYGDPAGIASIYSHIPEYRQVSAQGFYEGKAFVIPCTSRMPRSVIWTFAGTQNRDFTVKMASDTLVGDRILDNFCLGAFQVQPGNSANGWWTIGSGLMRNVQTEFDMDTHSVSLYEL